MTDEYCRLLAVTVALYDERDRPVTPTVAADRLQTGRREVAARFRALADCELVASVGDGYRPTVTGRELLALDVDCTSVVVDARPER